MEGSDTVSQKDICFRRQVVVQLGLRVVPVEREIPSASLRAGSSLRLKNGYAKDDKVL